jgi:uncharacterized protein
MTFLLDVNVLIALIDPTHVSHDAAHVWFERQGGASWATCPITANAVVRIVGHAKYPNTPGSPAVVADVLTRFTARTGHVFWPDDVSLLDGRYVDAGKLLTSGQVTDTYLLALAVAHGGQLASLDRRLSVAAVHGGKAGLRLI